MRDWSILKKCLLFITVFLMLGVIIFKIDAFDAIAATCNHYLEIRFQGRVKSKDQSDTENAVPQSMAGNGNTVYLYKTRKNLNEGEDDRGYIVKVLNANTNSPKLVLPADAVYVGHGNGMTYYNGYMYFADGEEAKLYRVREEENSTQAWDSSTEWTNGKGTAHYEKKTLSLSGNKSGESIRNIAHYIGNYFIVCLDKSYNESTKTNSLTYGVAVLNNTTFTIQKRFYVNAKDTYGAVQDIDYRDGYLWAVLYQSNSTNNHIHLIELPASYTDIEDGKIYNVKKTISINKNEAGRANTLNEIESIYVYGGNYYTWSNIREGWNETFCQYSCFPVGVKVSTVSTKSDSSIEIKWDKVSSVEHYRIDRRNEGGEYSSIKTVDGSINSYTDNGLTPGTKYYYRVYGVNSAGTSPKKDGVQGVTKTDKPKVTSVTAVSDSELKVTWTAVTGAKKYIVCRKKEGSGEGWENYSRIKETTGTEYLDTGLEQNTKYYYGIIAINETGVESGGENGNPTSQNRMDGTTLETVELISVTPEMNEADFVLPEDVTEIEDAAFEGTDVKVVYISDNCRYIGEHAFRNSLVQQIRIPTDCVLKDNVFDGCGNLTIFGMAGSYAEDYAERYGFTFVTIE